MANYDAEQENLFKEIDEDLRQERFAKLWKKYGAYVISAAVALVVVVGAYQYWQYRTQQQHAEDSNLFSAALEAADQDKIGDATAMLDRLAANAGDGYALLARFDRAALMARSGDREAAISEYLAIAADGKVERDYRDMATLMATLHQLDNGEPQALIDRLAPLTDATNPWRHSAKEMTALLMKRAGEPQKAAGLFRELADDATAPPGIRARAAELAAIIGS
jgi:hypothetical protein